jgi:hypothetical protein
MSKGCLCDIPEKYRDGCECVEHGPETLNASDGHECSRCGWYEGTLKRWRSTFPRTFKAGTNEHGSFIRVERYVADYLCPVCPPMSESNEPGHETIIQTISKATNMVLREICGGGGLGTTEKRLKCSNCSMLVSIRVPLDWVPKRVTVASLTFKHLTPNGGPCGDLE